MQHHILLNIFSLTANFKNLLNFKMYYIQRYLQFFLKMYFLKIDLGAFFVS